jgi:hypothetical protein
MHNEGDDRGFSAEGAVVEILERGGERFAKILIEPGTVLELPAASADLSLGDRVIVDGSLNIERVRGGPDPARVPPHTAATAHGAPDGPARPVFRDYEHVLRMAGLFALAIVVFLAWRSWIVPSDFGVYGHYRAGAITEAAARTPGYAGQVSCIECHDEVQQVRLTGKHASVSCEACHGPLGKHARSETDVAPIRPSPRAVCLTCHTSMPGMPPGFPKVIVNEHSDAGPCTECHKAHTPGVE